MQVVEPSCTVEILGPEDSSSSCAISFIAILDDPGKLTGLRARLDGDAHIANCPLEFIIVEGDADHEVAAYRAGFAHATARFVNFCYTSSGFTEGCIAKFLEQVDDDVLYHLRPYFVTPKKKRVSYYPRDPREELRGEDFVSILDNPLGFNLSLGSYFIPRKLVRDDFFFEGHTNEAMLYGLIELLEDGCPRRYLDEGRYYFRRALFDAYNYAEQHKREWYTPSVRDELIGLLARHPSSRMVQGVVMHLLSVRYLCNYNTRDDGVLVGEEIDEFFEATGELLQGIDDDIIMTPSKFGTEKLPKFMRYLLLKYKYDFRGEHIEPKALHDEDGLTMQFRECTVAVPKDFRLKLYAINYKDGCLVIDGRLSNSYSLDKHKLEVYVMVGDQVVHAVPDKIYALSKFFGRSVDRAYAFQITIPNALFTDGADICGGIEYEGYRYDIPFRFTKIAARLSTVFSESYWQFGSWFLRCDHKGDTYRMQVGRLTALRHVGLERELLSRYCRAFMKKRDMRAAKSVVFRLAYWATKPLYRRKHVWVMFDQLFKGGDNGEYLFRYVMDEGTDKSIAPYYILNKNAVEYPELKRRYGRHVVHHKSPRTKLMALHADMIFATRADARLYCDIATRITSYIGDLFNGHVVCLQHGLTIQRIAQYQNRLFDNTRLYFLVSPLERENISHEVYGYTDDMLVMTGAPRYDGLVRRDKRQIVITPTWRRSVTAGTNTKGKKNEYSVNFKHTPYFEVYNRLINDERLIAAAQNYGYELIYLIHPILSPQIRDFSVNDQVTIVPGSEVNYEELLSDASLMVTDYSGIQFDFAYLRKPVVYYHPAVLPPQYDSSVYDYETRGLGPVYADHDELVDALCAYMSNGCMLESEYAQRIEGFFAFNDRHNAQRVYEESLKYTAKHFSHERGKRTSGDIVQYKLDPWLWKAAKRSSTLTVLSAGKELASKSAIDYYYEASVDENAVLVLGLGTSVRGNMQYVLDVLNHDDRFAHLHIYVRTKDYTDEVVCQYIEQNGWTRTTTFQSGYRKYLETCKYLITESYFPYQWIKRPGQVLINTWHGTPLKCLGVLKNGNKSHKSAVQQKNFLYNDYFLYPNAFTRDVMHDSYRVSTIMPGKELMLGYPRVAGMLKVTDERKAELRAELAPNGEQLFAYMPTFRGGLTDEEAVAREAKLLNFLDARLRDDQILYVNLHHHIGGSLDFSPYAHIRKFPSLIDSYELLTVTDALISDYSSVFFDYLALGKQIVLYIKDYAAYRKHQGLNMDIEELPFDLARNPKQLIRALNRGKQYDDTAFRAEICAYDAPDNPEKLCQLFVDDESGLELQSMPRNDKMKVLVYSAACAAGEATGNLPAYLRALDSDHVQAWIGCDANQVNENIGGAYPLLHEFDALSSYDDADLSSVGIPVKELYLEGKIAFNEAMRLLMHEYALMVPRMFGEAPFDVLAAYDVTNPEVIIGFALSSAKRKLLFVQEPLLDELAAGNTFVRDAIGFATRYCDAVVVTHKAYIEPIKLVVPASWHNRIIVVDNPDSFKHLIENE